MIDRYLSDILVQDEVYFLFRDWGILPKANIGLENDLPHFGPTYPDDFEPAPGSHTWDRGSFEDIIHANRRPNQGRVPLDKGKSTKDNTHFLIVNMDN
ncbi:hypothetical protein CDV36_000826 [Fusarium kuroshium]|uniref:Uncharacterized protein n=1 Tax=Fusarium kuroshium TaxID=2010991 RepID=A0A3M2SPT0_9HYPO|nr:hypothetical protein CDV36_000826 [Fusarium kuroshium]